MADKVVDAESVIAVHESQGLWGPYWIDTLKGAVIYLRSFDLYLGYTDDGGATWSNTLMEAGTERQLAVWFDRETPGDTGTLLHLAWLNTEDSDVRYVNVDIDDATVGTIRDVDTGVTVGGTNTSNRIAITKTVSGNLICAFSTPTEIECYKSDDLFATAGTDIADPYETTTEEDWLLLYPADTADENDACGIFWDRSADAISIKMYDDSADTWTETAISSSMNDNQTYINMDAALRQSDSHILLAAHTSWDNNGDDLKTWDLTPDSIATPTVTAKTNIFTNQNESAQAAVMINQQNDEVYVAYLKGGTWQSETDVVFHKSDDGMANWGSEQAYSEAAADDNRNLSGGRTVGDDGGRIQWAWFNDDLGKIYVNLVNDIILPVVPITNFQINIDDAWRDYDNIKINIGDTWKDVVGVQINIGDTWKDVF